jgi:hypothetical protein
MVSEGSANQEREKATDPVKMEPERVASPQCALSEQKSHGECLRSPRRRLQCRAFPSKASTVYGELTELILQTLRFASMHPNLLLLRISSTTGTPKTSLESYRNQTLHIITESLETV